MKQQPVTALALDRSSAYRAAYVLPVDGHDQEVKEHVIGFAAQGGRVVPLRVDRRLGRAVLVGTADDPDRDRFFGLLVAGESMADLGEDVDRQVMDLLRGEMEEPDEDA